MSAYSVVLFLHLLFLLAAVAGAALAGCAALRLRDVKSAGEAASCSALIARVVPIFPVAAVGLIGTGAYMTYGTWSWSTPWIVAGLAGLGIIMALGPGVEGRCARAARAELRTAGLSDRARRLLRDPLSWSAKVTTWTLMLAVTLVMTTKPPAGTCAVALAAALIGGVLGAVPFWRSPPGRSGAPLAQS